VLQSPQEVASVILSFSLSAAYSTRYFGFLQANEKKKVEK
jgi:hypothetical protein